MPENHTMTSTPHPAGLDARATPDSLLDAQALADQLIHLPQWTARNGALHRRFSFADFHQTMAFVNAVAWIAHRADHHPDMEVGYNRCELRWNTHSAGGLTLKDVICAAQVDQLQCPTA